MRTCILLGLVIAGLGCGETSGDVATLLAPSQPAPATTTVPTPMPSASALASAQASATPSASTSVEARPAIRAVLAAIPEDPAPPNIIRETHYFVSNEPKPEAFRRAAEGLGGIYLGVGAEQNYLFAGWARPEVLIVVDFDQWVVDVHFIHGLLMQHAPDAEAFVALWSRDQRRRAMDLIRENAPDGAARQRLLEGFEVMRSGVYSKLLNQQVGFRGRQIPTWLTDASQYEHLAGLYRRGHARALLGDFTGRQTLSGVAQAARQLGLPVRTLYLSNVEDYFRYSSGLGANLLAQPIDDKSMLLRTLANGEGYRYVTQRMSDFQRWLALPGVDHRLDIFSRTSVRYGAQGAYIGGPPDVRN